ncbi:histidinol-phosphate transaminase [Ruminococcaceae bacterium OttesenSCG-928-O06]|nr:histidinol-phosphate transaminase [Ruminococcaceae bacterium OttesenSCG-928-O06]
MSQYLDAKYAALQPYTPGEQPRDADYTKLNTNESPFAPSPKVQLAVASEVACLNRYPDPAAHELRESFATYYGVETDCVFFGNGSDEILAFCFQALCPQGAAFADITYGFYPVYCALYGVQHTLVPLREDFSLVPEDYYGMGRTIFIANPNAPTGLALSRRQVEDILQNNAGSLVIMDEAYVDFGGESAVPLLTKYNNLLVVGTFSKSRALAGGRLGYAMGSKELIEDLNRVRFSFNPYNLSRTTLAAGTAAIRDEAYHDKCCRSIVQTRAETARALEKMGFECTDSHANFLFCSHETMPAQELYTLLKERRVLVRWFDQPRIQNWLRVTIGTKEEMDKFFFELRKILRETKD